MENVRPITEIPAFRALTLPCSDPALEQRRVALLEEIVALFERCEQFGVDLELYHMNRRAVCNRLRTHPAFPSPTHRVAPRCHRRLLAGNSLFPKRYWPGGSTAPHTPATHVENRAVGSLLTQNQKPISAAIERPRKFQITKLNSGRANG